MHKTLKKILGLVLAVSFIVGVREFNKFFFRVEPGASTPHTLHVLTWEEYIPQELIKSFEKQHNVKVRLDLIDSEESLETKVLAGLEGYDVVFPTTPYIAKHIELGVYQELKPADIPQLPHFDTQVLGAVKGEGGKIYALPYLWGTTGIAYNEHKMQRAFPGKTIDSWAYLFEAEKLKKAAPYGVALSQSATDLFNAAKIYNGYALTDFSVSTLEDLTQKVLAVRDYYKIFLHSDQSANAIISGEIGITQSWSSSVRQANEVKDREDLSLRYIIPKEGAAWWVDCIAIPSQTPNKKLALAFINHLVAPKHIAVCSNFAKSANANKASYQYVDKGLLNDRVVFPDKEMMKRLYPDPVVGAEFSHYNRHRNKNFFKILVGKMQ